MIHVSGHGGDAGNIPVRQHGRVQTEHLQVQRSQTPPPNDETNLTAYNRQQTKAAGHREFRGGCV